MPIPPFVRPSLLRPNLFRLGLSVALALVAVPAPAEEKPPAEAFGETLDVYVVNVEVRVRDRQGNPVTGLEPGDFTLREGRRKVEITQFLEVPPVPPPTETAAVASESPAANESSPDRVVFVFDDTRVVPRDRSRVLGELKELIEEGIAEDAFVALAVYDGQMRVVEQPTRDRAGLLEAVDRIDGNPAAGIRAQREERAVLLGILAEAEALLEEVRAGVIDTGEAERKLNSLLREVEAEAQQVRSRDARRLGALGAMVEGLAQLRGRKALIYIGDGLELRPGEAAREVIQRAFSELYSRGGGAGQSGGSIDARSAALGAISDQGSRPPRRRKKGSPPPDELFAVTALAAASRVSFYPWKGQGNPGVAEASVGVGAGRAFSPDIRRLEDESRTATLGILAAETGGRVAIGTSFKKLVERAVEDFGGYYSLGFSPDHGGDGRLHKLKVKVDRPRVEVWHPKTYLALPPVRPGAESPVE